jgi:hypothetical protein
MSHRPEDHYEYVAKEDVFSGTVRAFAAGDPVPGETVEALGLLDSGQVCHRDDYERPEGVEVSPQPAKRGEMPPHLQDSAVPASADTGSSREKTKQAAEGDELARPNKDDSKIAWVDYATDERNADRLSHDEAMNMTKSALMERFK